MKALETKHSVNKVFKIISSGNIGGKAEGFISKGAALKKIGWRIPDTVIHAENYFNDFLRRNKIGNSIQEIEYSPKNEELVKNGSFSKENMKDFELLSKYFGNRLLAVRESAVGNPRGRNIFVSDFCQSFAEAIAKSFKTVLAGNFTEDAFDYRRNNEIENGFAVITQALVGQNFGKHFAPAVSGYGYTDSLRYGPYINMVPFLGGGVNARNGEKVLFKKFENKKHLTFSDYRLFRQKEIVGQKHPSFSSILQSAGEFENRIYYNGLSYLLDDTLPEITLTSGEFCTDNHSINTLNSWDLISFYKMMRTMTKVFGKPQYFEWAATAENGKIILWILQIADVDEAGPDLFSFTDDNSRAILTSDCFKGTGIRPANILFDFYKEDFGIEDLYSFNKEFNDYILIAPAFKQGQLRYKDYSNASLIIEINPYEHSQDPEQHFIDSLEGKIFGTMDHEKINWDLIKELKTQKVGFPVYEGNFKITGSERQGKIMVTLDDEH